MKAKRTKKNSTLNSLKETTKREIETCEIMIDFYNKLAETMTQEEKGQTMLKVDKIQGSLKFNKVFDEYLKSL